MTKIRLDSRFSRAARWGAQEVSWGIALVAGLVASCGVVSGGDECASDNECGGGLICRSGQCVAWTGTGNEGDPDAGTTDGSGTDGSGVPGIKDGTTPYGTVPQSGGSSSAVDDGLSPEIVIQSPASGTMVAETVAVQVHVFDPNGVDPSSVRVIAGDDLALEVTGVGSSYVAELDPQDLGADYALPTIQVFAADIYGNTGTVSIYVAIDTTPPRIALESADVTYWRVADDGNVEWTDPFKPLGESAVTHGITVFPDYLYGASFFPRVRTQDRGNDAGSKAGIWYAGLEETSGQLHVLESDLVGAGHLLLQGSGSSGSPCTVVDPDQVAVALPLEPIPPSGTPFWLPPEGEEAEEPVEICPGAGGDGIKTWLHRAFWAPNDPVIYAVAPYIAESITRCSGAPVDAANFSDGPACLAASVKDKHGNLGISEIIAICIDSDGVGNECATFDADVTRAACSDGCVASSGYPDEDALRYE